MDNLTDREKKLLGYIKILINTITMFGIFSDQIVKIFNWRADTLKSIGMNMGFQDEMLKFLEEEYNIKYKKLDQITHEEIKEDGSQD